MVLELKKFQRSGDRRMALEKYETRISKSETNLKSKCPNIPN
ncbi:hypothetical protein D1AOALGA4SA_7164 [Olavius algarvensis Delta 1 endosymbiont]|nr:hypothetical protein D1AOALGA4SA_7164 [Olavius algarvensis Delta 1 endosymbiont]